MNCPICTAWSRILETRCVRRRRECANLHRFTTIDVIAGLSEAQQEQRIEQARGVLRAKGHLR